MKKLKVLQVITRADWAGAQKVVYEICKHIKENENNDIEVEVATGDDGILVERLRSLGIKVFILENLKHKIIPSVDAKGYREIKKIIWENKYDVVHCHSTKAGLLGRLAASSLGINKIVYTVHGFWPILQYEGIKRKMAARVERFMSSKTTDMVFISKSDIETAKELGLYSSQNYRLIYNSIAVSEVEGMLRNELNLGNDMRIIGNLSRVDEQKNPFFFVELAREYFKQFPEDMTTFVWIGDGSFLDSARSKVKEYNLENKVFFIGFRDRGERYLADFDLLLMTSRWEGVPITILEALELKVPILSSDVGGISEVIGDENVYNLTDAIQDIATRIKGEHAPVNKSYSKMAENYAKLYKS
jgi:glycosyltransferase involved in cell wall biosynthesis